MGNAQQPRTVTLDQCIELLEARRQQLCDELLEYARPVAACDADFNALLVERSAIAQALGLLQPIGRAEVHISSRREDLLALTFIR